MVRGHKSEEEASDVVTLEPGHSVFNEGEAGDELYIVQEGEVELLKGSGGQALRLTLLGPGEFFGEGSVLEGRRREATARTVSPCRLLRIDGATLAELVRHHPEVGLHMIRRLSRRLAMAYGVPATTSAPEEARPEPSVAAPARSPRIVHESGAEFPLSSETELMVGRSDPKSHFTPQIDLSRLLPGGAQRSLSRRHAVILRVGEEFYVRELPRVPNGTWVNGQKLDEGVPMKIKDGDQIRFGTVETIFRG
jgi:CRP-like cAMP-binding protein